MSEKPILFSGEMVRAILEGRKTQTRRVMKVQPEKQGGGWMYDGQYFVSDEDMQSHLFHNVYGDKGSPYGASYADGTADRLWVRETWNAQNPGRQWWHEVAPGNRILHNWAWTNPIRPAFDAIPDRWLPSIHMPRAASRITLEIVNVRVERIQHITCADAGAEGVNGDSDAEVYVNFQDLWDHINTPRGYGWDVNPWVWVIEFKVV